MTDVAVITGASSGIGLATAAALAAAGWTVVATARRPEGAAALQALADASDSVEVRRLDVTDDRSVADCVDAVQAAYGSIGLLVNNAGAGFRGTVEQIRLDDLRSVMDVNFFGVVRMTKAVLPAMRAAGRGRIITVTSLNGIVALPFSDAYNAAKFAVEGLMEGLAAVVREFGVRVSVLEPGPVRTPFFTSMGGLAGGAAADDPYSELLARYNARIAALGAAGQTAESVAGAVVAMASDPDPALRYQSSEQARGMAARKLVDPSGRSILEATGALLAPDSEAGRSS